MHQTIRKQADAGNTLTPAAQYVRMSTEHQKYSTANQRDAIAIYASEKGLRIVKTYADEGKSGLRLNGRSGLIRS
jgi:DNA invertase Pin-like site-specific DNA recombinase